MITICSEVIHISDVGAVKELCELEDNIDREYKKYLREIIQFTEFSLNRTEMKELKLLSYQFAYSTVL